MTFNPAQYTELDKVTELYAISEKENRELKTALYRLERQMAGVAEDSPEASAVRELLDLWWVEVMDSNANVSHDLGSTRAAKVRAALKRRRKSAKKNGQPPEHGFEMCRKAILGAREDDWAMGRVAKSGGRKFNDIAEHILNTDGDIEKFAALFDKRGEKATKPVALAPRPAPLAPVDADPLPSEQDIAALAGALQANEEVLTAALRVKGWSPGTLLELGVGFDGQRLVFPVRDSEGTLVSVARYAPRQKPKMLAPKGRPRDLFPAPETIQGEELWIVEGEPDAVTAHQLGLPAVGVPGAAKWQDDWMPRLAASRVVVCFDCDDAGRRAAKRVRSEIASMPHPSDVRVLDLDPSRSDGFDLTDFVLAGGTVEQLRDLSVPLRSAA